MRGFLCAFALFLSLGITDAFADAPKLESVFPAGGRKGSEFDVTLNGTFKPWPCKLWASVKGIEFTPDAAKSGVGKLKIAADTPVGPLLLRAYNSEGGSIPVIFVIGEQEEIREVEADNNSVSEAMVIDREKLPLTVHGSLATSNELDAYRITMKKGETLHAGIDAYALRGPVDPALHVYDPAGHSLLLAHDGPRNLDPSFVFTAPADGDYVVVVVGFAHPPATTITFIGSRNANYRLCLAWKPEQLPAWMHPLDLGPDSPENTLAAGDTRVGTLKSADGNRYTINAKKGDRLNVKVEGRMIGYAIDPILQILTADGAVIRTEDDTNATADPEYLWTVSADGVFTISITDRFRRSGDAMRYRLTTLSSKPDFSLTANQSSYVIERGKPTEIRVTITRKLDHKSPLELTVKGLPAGIVVTPPEIVKAETKELVLKLEAKDGAPGFDGAIRVVATEKTEGDGKAESREAVISFKDDNYRGPYLLNDYSDLWLTLAPIPEKKEQPVVKKPEEMGMSMQATEKKEAKPAAKKEEKPIQK